MNVVAVLGSPRLSGNSTAIANTFCDTARARGAKTMVFVLQQLKYNGCVGCMGCKISSEVCVVRDGLSEVLSAVADADVVVLATPIYFGDVSSQMKGFIDRTFSFLKPDFTTNPKPGRLAPGKTLVFVQTQGWDESQFGDVYERYQGAFRFEGFTDAHLIRGCGLGDPGGAAADEALMRRTQELAEKICT